MLIAKVTILAYTLSLTASFTHATVIIPKPHNSGISGKFIHVTDFHLDPHYVEGASVSSFCHRKDGNTTQGTAGRFGALGSRCDSPIALIDAAFEFMKAQVHDADFVIYTGDSVRHDRDNGLPRTEQEVQAIQDRLVQYFVKTFSKVIPVLGNNDVKTHNNIMPYDEQYPLFEKIWAPYKLNLGSEFKQGGFYIQEISPSLRAISTNTMSFCEKNELLMTDCDAAGSPGRVQLDWLKRSLQETRTKKSKAYILAHVPPNNKKDKHYYKTNCYNEYYNILGSYSDVILAHLSGHFNYDQLTAVLQNQKDGTYIRVAALGAEEVPMTAAELELYKVVGVLFNAPSIIPQHNPAVRIYTYETEGTRYPMGTILDWDQYYANIEEANQSGSLTFKLEYTASKLYNVDHFDANGLQTVFEAISLNDQVRQQYSVYRAVSSEKNAEAVSE